MLKKLSRQKPKQPNQPKLHWFDFYFKSQPNKPKLNYILFYVAVRITFNFKTEPNCTTNTPNWYHTYAIICIYIF